MWPSRQKLGELMAEAGEPLWKTSLIVQQDRSVRLCEKWPPGIKEKAVALASDHETLVNAGEDARKLPMSPTT